MKILVELEFDENDLGLNWMNPDSLGILLYTGASTNRSLLKVVRFEELPNQVDSVCECIHHDEWRETGMDFCPDCEQNFEKD